ncbi:hypothetical protein GCM10007989_22150 [Devosia pacifica]|uniref:DUF2125 domain-containing protein n=1 Tax=Devosia pacifica TaxID=1335967 RepID=A0A918VV85_9HYPH|nr:DUF2125 domain-containing protein [Devosia pacifica]GHA26007.1 hypothetical protein GCM10007989_22150 [Devosia pacifica]
MNKFAILGLIVVLVVAAWAGIWFFVSGQIRQQVEMLAMADGETTPRLTCGDLEIGGFPFRFSVTCNTAEITSGDLTASLPAIDMQALVYRPTHLLAAAQGPAQISDAFTGNENAIAWQSLEASLQLTDWRIGRFSLVGEEVEWNDTLIGSDLIASSPHVEVHLIDMADHHQPDAGLASLAGYAVANDLAVPLAGIGSGEVTLEAELRNLPDDLRALDAPDLLRRWQQSEGELNLISLAASDGEDTMAADGTVRLTDSGLAEGQITVQSNGLIERFATAIPEPLRGMVMGEATDEGGFTQTINIRGGVVMIGLLPAAMIPSLFAASP